MESALTMCIKAGNGGDLHHPSNVLDTCELRSLTNTISNLLSKKLPILSAWWYL